MAKQPTTPGRNRVYLNFIYDALGAKPQELSSLEDILNWIRVNRLAKYLTNMRRRIQLNSSLAVPYPVKRGSARLHFNRIPATGFQARVRPNYALIFHKKKYRRYLTAYLTRPRYLA